MQPIKKGKSKLANFKLIADENISWRIKKALPEWNIIPVNELPIQEKLTDRVVWNYAKTHGFTILTFDEDFVELLNLYDFPPKVIWLRLGNVTTIEISSRLLKLKDALMGFIEDDNVGVFEIY